jgi:hypothetical protein
VINVFADGAGQGQPALKSVLNTVIHTDVTDHAEAQEKDQNA